MENEKVWFVTGASKGLGLSLVKQLLAAGYKVAATSRNISDLVRAVNTDSGKFLPLAVNLKSEESVQEAISKTADRFGRIDVVVNNAGYGLAGSLEELSDSESRENFEINVFGTLNVIRKVMPLMRAQQSGHIFNISSIAGFTGSFPGFGIYCATKFAVQGLTESLAAEARAFGIKATVVSPGYFRTEFLTGNSLNTPENPIQAYSEVRKIQQVHEQEINGNQPGDPEKAVAVIIEAAKSENPPLHLFLGEDAYKLAYEKMEMIKVDLENWTELASHTSFEYVSE